MERHLQNLITHLRRDLDRLTTENQQLKAELEGERSQRIAKHNKNVELLNQNAELIAERNNALHILDQGWQNLNKWSSIPDCDRGVL